jgi:hypothetical protein
MSEPLKPPEVDFDPYVLQHGEHCAYYTLWQELYDSRLFIIGEQVRLKDERVMLEDFNNKVTTNLQVRAFKQFTRSWRRVCADKQIGWLIPNSVKIMRYSGSITVVVLINGKPTEVHIGSVKRIFNDTRQMNPAITNSMLGGRRKQTRRRRSMRRR